MNNSIYKINLELHEVGSQLTLTAKAYDTARQIRCTFTDNGRPYVITDDCFAVFTAKKPDGNILFNATHIDGNVVHYDFTVNTVNASGVLECEMRLYNGNGKLITSPRFSILVDDTVYHDGDVIESASEYTALTKLMEMVVSTLGEIPSPVLYGMAQNLSGEQKEQARKNIGAASEQLVAEMINAPYTTLTRGKYAILTVHCHGLQERKAYRLHLYAVSRHRGNRHGAWYHPANYDAVPENGAPEQRIGYGCFAGITMDGIEFPSVPEWMPNDGYLQTEWDIGADGTVTIDLKEWILPLLKPPAGKWEIFVLDGDRYHLAGLIGVSNSSLACRLFRFCLVADETVYPCLDTVSIGGKCYTDADGSSKIHRVLVPIGGTIAASISLFISIK